MDPKQLCAWPRHALDVPTSWEKAASVLAWRERRSPTWDAPHSVRDNYNIRVPEAIGDVVRDLADERGLSFNEVISEALREHFGVPMPLPRFRRQTEELPLTA